MSQMASLVSTKSFYKSLRPKKKFLIRQIFFQETNFIFTAAGTAFVAFLGILIE